MRENSDTGRTLSQRLLAHHQVDEAGEAEEGLLTLKVDQVILSRKPNLVLGRAVGSGLTRSAVEVSVAYPPYCIATDRSEVDANSPFVIPPDTVSLGFLVAQPGAGFASAIHLERFASPGRLALTDDPRLAPTGATGMLTLVASTAQLTEALLTGQTKLRAPVTVQVSLSGRLRPFVGYRDAALELLRMELAELVQKADAENQAPVVIEFGGPSSKLLSVADRATLSGLAPQVGAAAALFASDDKTEIFLRDQRRSKAYRVLSPAAGGSHEGALQLDLSVVEPLLLDDRGMIRMVRELEGTEVSQVLLGGDSGASLRDILTACALLKSKRVAPNVEFLLAPPSRQCLEVLSMGDALHSFIASGARLVEPDRRLLSGELYPCRHEGVSLQTSDPDTCQRTPGGMVASAETLAWAVAHGELGDPRAFKRPVRVSVPRQLPTDDVLLARGSEARGGAKGKGRVDHRHASSPPPAPDQFATGSTGPSWHGSTELLLCARRELRARPSAVVASCPQDVEWLIEQAHCHPELRAVIAEHIPAATVAVLADLGILALRAEAPLLARLADGRRVSVPEPNAWQEDQIELSLDDEPVRLRWLAVGRERDWTSSRDSD